MRPVARLAVFSAFLILPLWAGQSAEQAKSPPCAALPDDPANYADNMVRPKYPKEALRNGIAGTVELKAVVASDGKLKDLVAKSGDTEFSGSAIAAIRKWRFHPQVRQGQPVETTYKIQVRFNPLLQEANCDVGLESPQPEPPPTSTLSRTDRPGMSPDVHYLSESGTVAPKQTFAPEPEFSEASRKNREQGDVEIALVVGTDGLPRDLHVICSSIPDSTQNAIDSVNQWKCEPGTMDGTPVPIAIAIHVSFTAVTTP